MPWVIQLLVSAFLAILFLQSGLDKIFDRQGNLGWLEDHFARSPLAGRVPLLLSVVAIVEVAAGVFSAFGFLVLLVTGDTRLAYLGAVLAAVALVMLFTGQRLAKDYEGAAVLVSYFLLTLAAIYVLQPVV